MTTGTEPNKAPAIIGPHANTSPTWRVPTTPKATVNLLVVRKKVRAYRYSLQDSVKRRRTPTQPLAESRVDQSLP